MVDHDDARASAQKAQQAMGTKVIYHDGNGGMAEYSDAPHIMGKSNDKMPSIESLPHPESLPGYRNS